MGQYNDPPLADGLAPGGLTTSLPPGPGTRWFNGREFVQGVAYATSKLMGERVPRRGVPIRRRTHERVRADRLVPAGREPAGDDQYICPAGRGR